MTLKRAKSKRKRGIILLMVVSLVALFILMGVTYALIANQYLYATKLEKESGRLGDTPETEADMIAGLVLYDGKNPTSLQGQGILRDLYGYDANVTTDPNDPNYTTNITTSINRETVFGKVTASSTPAATAQTGTGGQFYTFQFVTVPNSKFANLPNSTINPTSLSPTPGYYNGRVITFLKGQAANHSTRIVGYIPNPSSTTTGQFLIEAIESKLNGSVTSLLADQDEFIVNGAPFNGAGTGYDISSLSVDLKFEATDPSNTSMYLSPVPASLLPHHAAYRGRLAYSGSPSTFVQGLTKSIDMGGVDEPWDAVDLQTIFLAMVPPRAAESYQAGIAANYIPIIPSYHRPELVNYWFNNPPSDRSPLQPLAYVSSLPTYDNTSYHKQSEAHRDFVRMFVFRPMPWDHPNFTGSNPNFVGTFDAASNTTTHGVLNNWSALVYALMGRDSTNSANLATWDVDNDGDGIPDSIWIDPGLPAITTPDGRRYKRLAAILIKDLDGSIDLNAHGNLAQVLSANFRAEEQLQSAMVGSSYAPPASYLLGLAPTNVTVSRGLGFGPAEVDYLNILSTAVPPAKTYSDNNAFQAYQQLLRARYMSGYTGDGPTTALPGRPTFRDQLSAVKHAGIPDNYVGVYNQANQATWYGSPPDVWGRGAVVLDVGGQPLYVNSATTGEMTDSPYELALSGQLNNYDSPYTPTELEKQLRYHDNDVRSLASRATDLPLTKAVLSLDPPGTIGPSHHRRQMLAGMTSHIPAPATTLPQEMRSGVGTGVGHSSILDLYRARLQFGMGVGATATQINNQMRQIVPWEFFKGQKFDLNRWLGDGTDTNGDNARDDPGEAVGSTNEPAWASTVTNLPSMFSGITAQRTNGIPIHNNNARQLYVRHLFCLAMLMLPPDPSNPANATCFTPSFAFSSPQEKAQATSSPTYQALYQRLVIRRIAQWAVNCVDFRDYDSVMTPFEFDYNPWDGWQVDGNISTDGVNKAEIDVTTGNPLATPFADRGLVWGMEHPELLITETLAFHDRRVKDTDLDPTMKKRDTPTASNQDEDLDQFRIPEGSLFLELYCPRAYQWGGPTSWIKGGTPVNQAGNQKPQLPLELYDANGGLMLYSTGGSAVWRLALAPLNKTAGTNPNHPGNHGVNYPESTSFDPVNMNLLFEPNNAGTSGALPAPITVDRYVYFGNLASVPTAQKGRAFYISNSATPTVQPGQYAVVGPRTATYLGSLVPTDTTKSWWGGNSKQYIDLSTGVTVYDTTGTNTTTRTPNTDIRPVRSIVCDMPSASIPTGKPPGWTKPIPWNIGMNVTEPLPIGNYYSEPLPPSSAPNGFYDDPDPAKAQMSFPDLPEESSQPLSPGSTSGRPIADQGMDNTGTYFNASAVFLQRLANPNLPYNPPPYDAAGQPDPDYNSSLTFINPYITVDWASIDVTVFNGEEDDSRTVPGTPPEIDPDDKKPFTGGLETHFRTRQRGYQSYPPNAASPYNPWPPLTVPYATIPTSPFPATPLSPPAISSPYFNLDFKNRSTIIPAQPYDPTQDYHSLGYLNQTVDQLLNSTTNPKYLGEPANPFPWLAWHNRPFSNPLELLVVPSSSPSRVCSEITPGFMSGTPGTTSPYSDANADPTAFRYPFGQLLNFFESENVQIMAGAGKAYAPHFYRLLDYVEVPSPYLGAERWYNPANTWGSNNLYPYNAPFNSLSRFRDPGRININTIFDQDVWDAAVSMFPNMYGPAAWSLVAQSRRGYQYGGNWYDMDPANPAPTRFGNPYRPADSADLMPNVPLSNSPPVSMRKTNPVEATFLRPDPTSTPQQPLFQLTSAQAYNNTSRNPYFAYQGYQKMGNIFGTTSNCFAVWITIGYFEVDPVAVDAAHPDGFTLGQEVGADSGEITRHRAFYIIDRSVPVGFIPGSRLNTDDCILLRRLIE